MIRALPRWTGETVVCIASGPSLTADDCAAARASGARVIVTNTTFRDCPWADALFAFDADWWRHYIAEVRTTFAGRLFCQSSSSPRKGVEWPGLDPRYRSFGNSGACAVALAVAAGARDIVLIGYDCQMTGGASHHHGDHPAPLRNCDTLPRWHRQFARLAAWTGARGARVVNASRETALECFPRSALAGALPAMRAAA
jgi:hypothetical protein